MPDLTPPHHRIKQSALLTPRQLAVLGALARLRDEVARSVNRPVHFIIRNDLLLQLAARPPATIKELRQLKSMHPVIYREPTARRLLEAVRQGRSAPEEIHPHLVKGPRSKSGYEQRLKAMQAWRALFAAPYGLEPYLMLSNDVLQWAARYSDRPMPPEIAGRIRLWQRRIVWPSFERQFLTPAGAKPE
jgi:ribonuclease D